MLFRAIGKTDVGIKRGHNEDAIYINNGIGLFIVADGMGGHAAGEVASDLCIKEFARVVEEGLSANGNDIEKLLFSAVEAANTKVYEVSQEDETKRGMGTTLCALFLHNEYAYITHVGDSRIYLFRDGEIKQLTVDHSLINEQLRLGLITKEEAEKATYRNVITRAVGIQPAVTPDIFKLKLLPKDRFIICSDGLSDYLKAPNDLVPHINRHDSPESLVGALISFANEKGGKDNISVIVVDYLEEEEKPAHLRTRREYRTLGSLDLFKHLNFRETTLLLNIAEERTFKRDEIILKEGESGSTMYVVVQGRCSVLKGTTKIGEIVEGSYFGEMALVDNSPRSATVVADTDTVCLCFDRKELFTLMRSQPNIAVKLLWNIAQVLSFRLRKADAQLQDAKDSFDVLDPTDMTYLLGE